MCSLAKVGTSWHSTRENGYQTGIQNGTGPPGRQLPSRYEITGAVYVDKVLPFGLRSAPLIFTAMADALQWMTECNGAMFIDHYINDYITVGSPISPIRRCIRCHDDNRLLAGLGL